MAQAAGPSAETKMGWSIAGLTGESDAYFEANGQCQALLGDEMQRCRRLGSIGGFPDHLQGGRWMWKTVNLLNGCGRVPSASVTAGWRREMLFETGSSKEGGVRD